MSGWDQRYDIEEAADFLSAHDDRRRIERDEQIDNEQETPCPPER